MANLVTNDDRILVCNPGMKYELKKDVIYELKYDRFNGTSYLKEGSELNMPSKLFEIEEDNKFIKRVLKYYHSDIATQTTGVLLTGLKGSGKSILAKKLAIASELPTIVVDKDFNITDTNSFFKGFDEEVCIIIDEAEKYEYSNQKRALLSFLDGIQFTSKKLVILTTNNKTELDSNLLDRCSRIRYIREYDDDSALRFIPDLCEFKGLTKDEAVEIALFIGDNLTVKSFDNISSFIDEYNLFKDEYSLQEIINEMNVSNLEDDDDDEDSL